MEYFYTYFYNRNRRPIQFCYKTLCNKLLDNMKYRELTLKEIEQLQSRSCRAEDWSSVMVANGPKRDRRTDPNRLDYINYNLLSPYTMQKMLKGLKILQSLIDASGELSDIYSYHSAKITNSALKRGIQLYKTAINKFLGNFIIKRLEGREIKSNEQVRERLVPDTCIGCGEWVDISGLIAPKSEVESLIERIESCEINRLKDINAEFEKMHLNYYTYEWR